MRLAEQRVAGIEQEAGRAALKAEELARRFGLTGEVPCVGTDLQGRCKLLGDAREALALIPNAQAQLARLAGEKAEARQWFADGKLPDVLGALGPLGYTPDSTLYDVLFATPQARAFKWPDPVAGGRENCTVGALRTQAKHVSVEPMLGMGGAKPVRVAGKPVTSGDINKMFADADAETAL